MANDKRQDIELGITRDKGASKERAVLELRTSKGFRSGVQATATVFWISEDGYRSRLLFGDFQQNVAATPAVKATQKAIDTLHAQAFTTAEIEALTEKAKEYYAGVEKLVEA